MKHWRVFVLGFVASLFSFSSGGADAQATSAYPDISGTYSVTETFTITVVSSIGENDSISDIATNPSLRVTQVGNRFSMTISDPTSGVSISQTGTLSGNSIVSLTGPAFGFQKIPGLIVNSNQINSGTGIVELNRITLNVTGSADVIATGQAADIIGVPSGTSAHYEVTANIVLRGPVTPLGATTPPSGCVASANGSTVNPLQVAVNAGLSLSVTCASGSPPLAYQWVQGSTGLGSTQTVATVAAPTATTRTYMVTISNGGGSATASINVQTTSLPPPAAANYQGLWWNSPAGSESGWGINFAHQGDVIFASWFTYDLTGKALWLTMTANKTAENVYSGTLVQSRGPAFSSVPYLSSAVSLAPVGTATLTFTNADNGTFAYMVNGIAQIKNITRQVFGALPTCIFGAQPDLSMATNYQDLWWAAPGGLESGWGVNFAHQGNTIFVTWFTYDFDSTPLWLSATAQRTSAGVYQGTLVRTTGPAFNAVPFQNANVAATAVGSVTVTFNNGLFGTFGYLVNLPGGPSVSQTKLITRQVFRSPGTACQ